MSMVNSENEASAGAAQPRGAEDDASHATGGTSTRLASHEDAVRSLHTLTSFTVTAGLFTLMFRVIPDAKVGWRDVWLGGTVTALLFTVGQVAIGLYLGKTSIGSAYGAASSLMIVLLWIFFSSCILFLGAEFTQVYANMYGSRITPTANALGVPPGMTAAAAADASKQHDGDRSKTRPSGSVRS